MWEWDKDRACQCECIGRSWGNHEIYLKQIYRNFKHGKTPQSVLCQWEDIVTRFSKLQLSYESDRLPALSGFAKQLQVADVNVGSYLAGLWSVCLPGLMLWIRSPSSPIPPKAFGICRAKSVLGRPSMALSCSRTSQRIMASTRCGFWTRSVRLLD